jgi:ABC-type Zn uptake system ZnuABC Zn-binding protein ZnuA
MDETGNSFTYINQHNLKVLKSFYPCCDVTQKMGGDKIDISLIIPFGVKHYYRGPPATEI